MKSNQLNNAFFYKPGPFTGGGGFFGFWRGKS